MTELEKINQQIAATVAELKKQNQRKRELLMNQKPKPKKKRGRKPMSPVIIRRAKLLALEMPIPSVALKLDVGLTTLYKYGIKRRLLNEEIA